MKPNRAGAVVHSRRQSNWVEVAPWLIERICGHYTVDRFPIAGSATGYRYTAWYRSSRGNVQGRIVENLGCYDTSKEAIRKCTAHLLSMRAQLERKSA